MRALVTGGTGLVGSNLTRRLIADGAEVTITGNEAEQRIPGFTGKILHPGFLGIDWDSLGPVDVCFHQAAINDTRFPDRREMFRANLDASRALFDHVIRGGCRRIVYATSTAVYGRTTPPYREDGDLDLNTVYAESKRGLEMLADAMVTEYPDVTFVGLRYCNIYGPGESHKGARATMIYQFAQQMLAGNPRLFEFGEQKRDYIYVDDVVRANLLAANAGTSCVVNCGTGKTTTFARLVEILNEVMGLSREPVFIPNPFAATYQDHTECDMTAAREKIGFTPEYDTKTGIRAYADTGALFPR
jgi:ADP-L-glycero-D-manno-heptose 6-epimerase